MRFNISNNSRIIFQNNEALKQIKYKIYTSTTVYSSTNLYMYSKNTNDGVNSYPDMKKQIRHVSNQMEHKWQWQEELLKILNLKVIENLIFPL